jgi:uncharacterized protein (DUF4415 family)
LQGRVIAVVHTEREDCTRIISARKATKYEQRIYFEQLLEWFKSQGRGYQTQINQLLRAYMEAHQ